MQTGRTARAVGWIRGLLAGMAVVLGAVAAQAQTPVRFSLAGRWDGPAAPFAVALDKGYFKDEGLDVTIEPAAGTQESLSRVTAGTSDAGIADVNALARLRASRQDAGAKAVMMIENRPPYAVVGRRSRGITRELSSLRDKTLGAPRSDPAFALWPALRKVNGFDDSGMRFENVGVRVREPMLAQGELDAVFGDTLTVYVDLKSRGVPAEDIVTLLMSDYGLAVYGDAVTVSATFARDRPEAVKGLLRAIVRAVRDVVKEPGSAVEAVLKRTEFGRKDVELERLRMALQQNMVTPWVKEHGFGDIDAERFAKAMDQLGLASGTGGLKPDDVFTASFLPPVEQRKVD